MSVLAAALAARGLLRLLLRRPRRIATRRLRGIARVLRDPPLQLLNPRCQRSKLRRHRQQHLDRGVPVTVYDRLCLRPIHTAIFESRTRNPLRAPERLPQPLRMQGFRRRNSGLPPRTGSNHALICRDFRLEWRFQPPLTPERPRPRPSRRNFGPPTAVANAEPAGAEDRGFVGHVNVARRDS